jgi:hypothetical protein
MLVSTTRYIATACFRKDISKVLPLFSIIYGVTLGLLGFFCTDIDMGKNFIEAFFIGLAAGSSATGFNQIGKQLYKDLDLNFDDDDEEEDVKEDVKEDTNNVDDESFVSDSLEDL